MTSKTPVFIILCAVFAVLGVNSACAQAGEDMDRRLDSLFGEHAPYHSFFNKLQSAVATGDRPEVASLISYPLKTTLDGKKATIEDTGHFIADYDRIITEPVKKAVAQQTYATLFANGDGVMIGSGEVWFSGICNDDTCSQQTIKITAINH